MQPFSVICETCRAQLRVRSGRIVGEIHACPKCGAMVLIQPPAGWSETPSEAATPSATVSSTPAPVKPQSVVAQPVPVVDQSFYEVGDLSGIDLETPAGPTSPAEVPVATVERWGRRVVWGSAAGSVAIVTASLVWSLWPGGDERVASVRQPPTAADPPVESVTEPPEEHSTEDSAATVVNKPEVAPEPAEAEPAAEFALPEPPLPEAPAPTPKPAEAAPPTPVEVVVTNTPPPIDPRDLDPEDLDLILLRRNPSGDTPPAAASNRDSRPALPDLTIGETGEVGEDATLARLERELAAAAKDAAPETVRRGPTSAEELQPAGLDELLQLTIPNIQVSKLPLHRAVAMLTELTAIPITLDPVALRMAGVSVDQKVPIRGQNVTAADLIRTTLAAAKLQYELRGNQLVVVRTGADKIEQRTYHAADLLALGASDAAGLAELIRTLIASETWVGQGGKGQMKVEQDQLVVTQSQAIHYDALIFCERLRKARGLPLRSRYPAALLRTKPLETALAPRLDRRTTFSFVTWTPLPEVIRHWQERSGLTILVDWVALADVQLTPASTIACAVEGVSWREALRDVLTPLGLAWIPVDEKTIQITSRAAAETQPYVEFYPLTKLSDAEPLATELRESLPGDGAVVFDAASRSLIVRANAAGQRHVATQLTLE